MTDPTAHPDWPAFLAAILARPDDDAPRLVLADWLDEIGANERAESVRWQIAMAEDPAWEPHVLVRLEQHGTAWVAPLARLFMPAAKPSVDFGYEGMRDGRRWLWWRGFVEELTCPAADWLRVADAVLAAHPVRAVTLTTVPSVSRSGFSVRLHASFPWRLDPWHADPRAPRLSHQDLARHLLGREWPAVAFTLPDGSTAGPARP